MSAFQNVIKPVFLMYVYILICSIITIGIIFFLVFIDSNFRGITKKSIDKMSRSQLVQSLFFDCFLIATFYFIANKITKYFIYLIFGIKDGLEKYHKEHYASNSLIIIFLLFHSPIFIRYKLKKLIPNKTSLL